MWKAINEFPGGPEIFSVKWKPYMIDPGTAQGGEDFDAYCRRRWGGSGWTENLRANGRSDGATFSDWRHWPNTLNAHKLVSYVDSAHDIDTDTSNAALFEALYERGRNISTVDEVVRVGVEDLGISDGDALRSYLNSDESGEEVHNEIEDGRRKYRIEGVPFFVIGGPGRDKPYSLSGAQSIRAFHEIFDEIAPGPHR